MQTQAFLAGAARRHPFRAAMRRLSADERRARDDGDVKLFLLSFSAFFVCFYTFIL